MPGTLSGEHGWTSVDSSGNVLERWLGYSTEEPGKAFLWCCGSGGLGVGVEMLVGRGDRTVNRAAAPTHPPFRGVEGQGSILCLTQANIFEYVMKRLSFLFFRFKVICIKCIQNTDEKMEERL